MPSVTDGTLGIDHYILKRQRPTAQRGIAIGGCAVGANDKRNLIVVIFGTNGEPVTQD